MGDAVLMIAYHFPPAAMGSGHLRTLGFARYLPAFDWNPIVLSVRPLAYPRTVPLDGNMIPPNCCVYRTLAFDARRHFGFGGKYPGFLAQPDRWASWWPTAVWQGLRLIRRYRVRAIWSTYPIMTAHHIAFTLSRLARVPWVADFRDPVSSSAEAGNRFTVASQRRWERRVVDRADSIVFTTPGARRSYAAHYPQAARDRRLSVIPNGYDEATFASLPAATPRQPGRPLRLVHSGMLYLDGRNPVPFFIALANLKAVGDLVEGDVRIMLRASGSEALYAKEIRRLGLDRMITLAAPVSNHEALCEQAAADALLLFQGDRFDRQIPAKVYEYLRIGRPIFALVGPDGDTAALLRETGGTRLVPMDDVPVIEQGFAEFIQALRAERAPTVTGSAVQRYSRYQGAVALAGLLDRVVRADRDGIYARDP